MKHILTLVAAGLFAVPAIALGQGMNTDALRPAPAPASAEAVRPSQSAFEARPVDLEALRAVKEGVLQNIKDHRERLKEAAVTERPTIRVELVQTREEALRLVEDRRRFVIDMLQEKKDAAQGTSTLRRLEVLESYVARFGEVLESRIAKLAAIADRAQERILRLEEERGADLSAASALLEEAYAMLEDAGQKAEEFSDNTAGAAEGEAAAAAQMKALRQEVHAAIRGAHQKLAEALAAIRAGISVEQQ